MRTRDENRVSHLPSGIAGGCLLTLALVTGCRVGPDFRAPVATVPATWTGAAGPGTASLTPAAEADLARWWTVFQDPELAALMERAVAANLDLQVAASRLRQARASRGAAATGPSVEASGSRRRSQPAGDAGGGRRMPTTNQYQTGFDAAWELDLFGGVHRGTEAADAEVRAAAAAWQGTRLTLVAEVARNYIELRSFQQRLEIARESLTAQERTAALTRQRYESGFVSGLDLAGAGAQAATTAAQIPRLEASVRRAIYSIALLLGLEPGALVQELSPVAAVPAAPPTVPVGLPSDLLRRRPDIVQAEARIHAATARIGVATADLYPHFALSGALGLQAASASDLVDPLSRFWSLGPSVTWHLFDSGRIRANVRLKQALEEESVLAYRLTVLTALQEVENALFASAKEQEHHQALRQAAEAYRRAARLAETLYTNGETDFLNVLSAQRALQAAEDALAQSTAALSLDLVALYKALGGGWDTNVPAPAGLDQARR